MGAAFIKRKKYDSYQMMLYVIGRANMGKSELLETIRAMYGTELCITPDAKLFSGSNFVASQLMSGTAKIIAADEAPAQSEREGGLSTGQFQNFVDQADLSCNAKHKQDLSRKVFDRFLVWAANEFVPYWSASDALLRRVICIDLNNYEFNELDEAPSIKIRRYEVRLHNYFICL
jgi:phage/plasmid-associated DNA primase